MAVDLPERLKNVYKGNITTVQNEYTHQVQKWKPYLNLIADKQNEAMTVFQKTLEDVRKQQEQDAQFAMLALSFLGGQALGWISSIVANKLYSKFNGTLKQMDSFGPDGYVFLSVGKAYDTVAAKAFGDSLAKVLGKPLDAMLKKISSKPFTRTEHGGLASAITSSQLGSFKSQIENALENEIGVTTAALGEWFADVNGDLKFGDSLLNNLGLLNPGARTSSDEDKASKAKDMIDNYFDLLRQQYAKDWFYYGNNPQMSSLLRVANHVETEIWAIWILDQDYKVDEHEDPLIQGRTEVNGRDGVALNYTIIGRLVEELGQTKLYDVAYDIQPMSRGVLPKTHPSIGPEHLTTVLDWAKHHPGHILGGLVDHVPREIGTISKPETIFQ